jgi:hypothetical protein
MRGVVVSALAALTLALAGCSGAVEVDSPDVDERTRAACARFLDQVPEKVGGQARRRTEPASAPAAAWGDPPIVVTCGVDMPDDFDAFSLCQEVNGVGWFIPEEADDDPDADVAMTTIGYRPTVRIDLPADYRPPADVLVEVSDVVKATLVRTKRCV